MSSFIENGARFRLTDPTLAPNSAGYLWNSAMMLQMNCRGYAVSQYMDPEPRKYAHVPTLSGQSFMQPEQGYFAHHPGRFFYLRDNKTGSLMSAPYEPVRAKWDSFAFEPGLNDIRWVLEKDGLRVELRLDIPTDDVVEIWSVTVTNTGGAARDISFVPYFPVGYASWMNQGGHFDAELNAIVATSVTPYQKVADYFKNRHLKDLTFFAADRAPQHFEASQQAFEGEGGLHNPSALQDGGHLGGGDALYEMAAGIMQWDLTIPAAGSEAFRFIFGPAHDKDEIRKLIASYLTSDLAPVRQAYADYIASGRGALSIDSPDADFNHFVNSWLPRQVFYHGDSNRLTTDPQTRNYLQDALGMMFIAPERTREVLLRSASQQFVSGKMPDGILLREGAELKYINQIPHSDHAVWLVITLKAYLDETGDMAILDERIGWCDSDATATLFDHLGKAVDYLSAQVDERGLPFIEQGDWCDPMNMVGYKGKGVSGWLAEAMSYAMTLWADICEAAGHADTAADMRQRAGAVNEIINRLLWDGAWYARGITDDDVPFGVSADTEGRIFLNAQSWAMLSGAADADRRASLLAEIERQLDTPYGTAMLAPAFTGMREDVGRVTQKWPGSAENGSVYNHAAMFYAAALYQCRESDRAFSVLDRMLTRPTDEDVRVRGQIPVYIPNYYRGAYYQFPRTAGRSSNLFNTGTVAWYYRLVIEQMCGVRGNGDDIIVDPQFPSAWERCSFTRRIRGCDVEVSFERTGAGTERRIEIDGVETPDGRITGPQPGRCYRVRVIAG